MRYYRIKWWLLGLAVAYVIRFVGPGMFIKKKVNYEFTLMKKSNLSWWLLKKASKKHKRKP